MMNVEFVEEMKMMVTQMGMENLVILYALQAKALTEMVSAMEGGGG